MKTVAVIGGGPGGYVTAIRLQQYGIDCMVFEKENLGGVCLNWGCIPTKAMVKSAEVYEEMKHCESFGLKAENLAVDFEKLMARKDKVVATLVSGVGQIFKKRAIEKIASKVTKITKLGEGYEIACDDDKTYKAKYIIIATGSKPKELPFMPFDGDKILSSKHILSLKEQPKSLAIVGGGVIGCEFASIFNTLGTATTIIEFLPNLVSFEDEEISKRLMIALKKSKIKTMLKTGVEGYEINENNEVVLKLSTGKEVVCEKVLVSVGRKPVFDIETEGFELEINPDGSIKTNKNMQTAEKNIFAIGDVTAKQMLAHTASKQGLIAAEFLKHLLNGNVKEINELNYDNIPRCTFTSPEVASVGLTEKQASELGEVKVGKFPFAANGKSLGLGNNFGFVKAVSVNDKLVGMHIIGPQATELIAQGAILIGTNLPIEKITEEIVFAHPTLSESVAEALEDTLGLSLHNV